MNTKGDNMGFVCVCVFSHFLLQLGECLFSVLLYLLFTSVLLLFINIWLS